MNIPAKSRYAVSFFISLLAYSFLAYELQREQFGLLISTFGILFLAFFMLMREGSRLEEGLKWGITAAIIFRLLFLFSIPNLSDDFYRFIWDGNLFINGMNPFAYTPSALLREGLGDIPSDIIYEGLNSAEYYTVYPPVCQFIFGLAAWIFEEHLLGNIIVMRLFILSAEIGSILILKKLLAHFHLNQKYLLLYALNPLVIIELTGNLHFEGIMIFFLLLSFYLFLKEKYLWSVCLFILAVNTKLIPLLLGPYLVFSLGWKKSTLFIPLAAAGTLLLHLPFLDSSFLNNFSDSLGLYFQTFEFNASIYYLVRWLGYQFEGYNIIQTAGPMLAAISTAFILLLSWLYRNKKLKNLPAVYIILSTVYLLFSTTVHPWYVIPLIAFLPLAGFIFPLAWSMVIPLTYAAYITSTYSENLWLVSVEYLVVFIFLVTDIYYYKSPITQKMKWFFKGT